MNATELSPLYYLTLPSRLKPDSYVIDNDKLLSFIVKDLLASETHNIRRGIVRNVSTSFDPINSITPEKIEITHRILGLIVDSNPLLGRIKLPLPKIPVLKSYVDYQPLEDGTFLTRFHFAVRKNHFSIDDLITNAEISLAQDENTRIVASSFSAKNESFNHKSHDYEISLRRGTYLNS